MKKFKLIALTLIFSQGIFAQGTRTEHDLFGDKQIPNDAYYGVQTARALENFTDQRSENKFLP